MGIGAEPTSEYQSLSTRVDLLELLAALTVIWFTITGGFK